MLIGVYAVGLLQDIVAVAFKFQLMANASRLFDTDSNPG